MTYIIYHKLSLAWSISSMNQSLVWLFSLGRICSVKDQLITAGQLSILVFVSCCRAMLFSLLLLYEEAPQCLLTHTHTHTHTRTHTHARTHAASQSIRTVTEDGCSSPPLQRTPSLELGRGNPTCSDVIYKWLLWLDKSFCWTEVIFWGTTHDFHGRRDEKR